MIQLIKYIFFVASLLMSQAFNGLAQSSAQADRGPSFIQLAPKALPQRIVGTPVGEPVVLGRVVIPYRTKNLRITPVFGGAAAGISPRIGHLIIPGDGAAWQWKDFAGKPIIIDGMVSKPHRIFIEPVDPTNGTKLRNTISFSLRDLKPIR